MNYQKGEYLNQMTMLNKLRVKYRLVKKGVKLRHALFLDDGCIYRYYASNDVPVLTIYMEYYNQRNRTNYYAQ